MLQTATEFKIVTIRHAQCLEITIVCGEEALIETKAESNITPREQDWEALRSGGLTVLP